MIIKENDFFYIQKLILYGNVMTNIHDKRYDWVKRKDWGKLRDMGMPAMLDPDQKIDVMNKNKEVKYYIEAKHVAWTIPCTDVYLCRTRNEKEKMTVEAFRIVDSCTTTEIPPIGSTPILWIPSFTTVCEEDKKRHSETVVVLEYLNKESAVVWCPTNPWKNDGRYWTTVIHHENLIMNIEQRAVDDMKMAIDGNLSREDGMKLFKAIKNGNVIGL